MQEAELDKSNSLVSALMTCDALASFRFLGYILFYNVLHLSVYFLNHFHPQLSKFMVGDTVDGRNAAAVEIYKTL